MSSSTWSMSSSLSISGQQRRVEIVETVHRLMKGSFPRDIIRELLANATKFVAPRLHKSNTLPTLSADYFGWCVEKEMWGFFMARGNVPDAPSYPHASREPKKYGPPYSEAYLSYLDNLEQQAEVAEELPSLEQNRLAPNPPQVPPDEERQLEVMKKLWEVMFPNRPYERGCDEPFVLRISSSGFTPDINFGSCFGATKAEVEATTERAAHMLGPEVVLYVFTNESDQVFLALGFHKWVNPDDSAVRRRFKQAWLDLLAVNLKWLRLRPIHIVDALEEINDSLVRSRPNQLLAETEQAYKALPGKVEARLQAAKRLSPDSQRAVKLLELQLARTRQAARVAASDVQAKVALEDLDADFSVIKRFVTDERFGCLASHELAKLVEEAAARLAGEHVRRLAIRFEEVAEAEETVTKFVLASSWDNVLPRLKRLEVCERTLGRYPLLRQSVDAWATRMRVRLSPSPNDASEGGDAQSLAEGMAVMAL